MHSLKSGFQSPPWDAPTYYRGPGPHAPWDPSESLVNPSGTGPYQGHRSSGSFAATYGAADSKHGWKAPRPPSGYDEQVRGRR